MSFKKTILLVCMTTICVYASSQQASLSGFYNGGTTKAWIAANPCLEVIYEPDMEVISFSVTAIYAHDGGSVEEV